jgi:hypothetical protein
VWRKGPRHYLKTVNRHFLPYPSTWSIFAHHFSVHNPGKWHVAFTRYAYLRSYSHNMYIYWHSHIIILSLCDELLKIIRCFHHFLGRAQIFTFSIASRPALGPIHSLIHWVLGAFSSEVKRQECEADHLPPSNAKVKNGGAIPPPPHMASWHIA